MPMTIAIYSNIPAPHQVPLARELCASDCVSALWFVHSETGSSERKSLGWPEYADSWIVCEKSEPVVAREILHTCDVLLSGNFDADLFEKRVERGLLTIYGSERWLKGWKGLFRMCVPKFFLKALKIRRLLENKHFFYFAYGIWAASDMARIMGVVSWHAGNLFHSPKLEFERRPCGRIFSVDSCTEWTCRMRIWGYSVEASTDSAARAKNKTLTVLWAGRMLRVKKVDTIIKAIAGLQNIRLDLIGDGPEERNLRLLAGKLKANVSFRAPMPMAEIRKEMQRHDVYVFSSCDGEGWGSVVNEALEEGMSVIGTYEAGSSATILPSDALYHSGDVKALRQKLLDPPPAVSIGAWSLRKMATSFLDFSKEHVNG